MMFTISRIDELIMCDKQITDAPTRDFREEYRHRRKDFRLQAANDPKLSFSVFMRQSLEFVEDFSLGLVYQSEDGKRITLVRYNGQHHQSNDLYDLEKPHFQYHIHRATPENLNNGRYEKHPATATPLYASFEEAIEEFLTAIGVRQPDISRYFPEINSLPLFRNPGTS